MRIPCLAADSGIGAALSGVLFIVVPLLYTVVWYKLGLWAYEDARSRNRSSGWVAVLVVGIFPIGWLLWLALRPPKKPASVIIPPMRKWVPPPQRKPPTPPQAPNRSTNLPLVAFCAIALTACDQRPAPPSSFPLLELLKSDTRAATTREILLSASTYKDLAFEDLATFERRNKIIDVLPVPAVGTPRAYLITMNHLGRKVPSIDSSIPDAFRLGRLFLRKQRAIVPYESPWVLAIRPNGSIIELSEGKLANPSSGFAADLNADGKIEIVEDEGVPVPSSAPSSARLFFKLLVIQNAEGTRGTPIAVAFNPSRQNGAAAEPWTYWAEDEDSDGIFSVHLGPVRLGRGESRVTLSWDTSDKRWIPTAHSAGLPAFVATSIDDAKRAMSDAVLAGRFPLPAAREPAPAASKRYPWEESLATPVAESYRVSSLSSADHPTLFTAMAADPWPVPHPTEFIAPRISHPEWSGDPRSVAQAVFRETTVFDSMPPSLYDPGAVTFDTLDGAQPPETGTITLRFTPGMVATRDFVGHFAVLRCQPGTSSFSVGTTLFPDSPTGFPRERAFDLRHLDLDDATARQWLQTIWWLSRIRPWPLASGNWNHRSTVMGERIEFTFACPNEPILQYPEGPIYDSIAIAVTWFLRTILPTAMQASWDAQATPGFRNHWPLSPASEDRLRDECRRILQAYISGRTTPEAMGFALSAIQEHCWTDLRVLVAAAAAHIPKPTPEQARREAIAVEMKRWRTTHDEKLVETSRVHHRIAARLRKPGQQEPRITPRLDGRAPEVELPTSDPITNEELEKFAELDALHAEFEHLASPSTEDLMNQSLRASTAELLTLLDAGNDIERLAAMANREWATGNPAIRRLAVLAPARAAAVLKETLIKGQEFPYTEQSIASLHKKAGIRDDSKYALAFGARPATEEDIALLEKVDTVSNRFHYEVSVGILHALVPPRGFLRHQWPGLDPALLKLQREKGAFPELTAALIRRGLVKEWTHNTRIEARALLAVHRPKEFRQPFMAFLENAIRQRSEDPAAVAHAAWLCDFRELRPLLVPLATSSAAQLTNGTRISPERDIRDGPYMLWDEPNKGLRDSPSHEVRWLLTLWDEPDPATRAKLLLTYAIARDVQPELKPEEWQRFCTSFLKAMVQAPPEKRGIVRDYVDWLARPDNPLVRQHIPYATAQAIFPAFRELLKRVPNQP